MRVKICDVNPKAKDRLPAVKPDASGVGINYADAYLKPFRAQLEDGSKVLFKRRCRGHPPTCPGRAARNAGAVFVEEDGALFLDL